ncbi:hypothetical protein NL676_034552 [Syzygium grande]|nr:hypothetical protein NL676_034552 [Syzygium grande]
MTVANLQTARGGEGTWKRTPQGGVSIASYSQERISRRDAGTRRGQTPRQERTWCSSLDLLLHVKVGGSSGSAWVMLRYRDTGRDQRRQQTAGEAGKASKFIRRSLGLACRTQRERQRRAMAGCGGGTDHESRTQGEKGIKLKDRAPLAMK